MKYILSIILFCNIYATSISYQFSRTDINNINHKMWESYTKPIERSETTETLFFKIQTTTLGENNLLFLDVLSPGIIKIYDHNLNELYQYGAKNEANTKQPLFPVFKLNDNSLYFIARTSIVRFDDKLQFISQKKLEELTFFGNNVSFLFLGSFFFMLLFHLGNFIITKNKNFLYYISFNFFYAIVVFSCSLQFHQLMQHTFFEENIMMFSSFAVFYMHSFAYSFLNFKTFVNNHIITFTLLLKRILIILGLIYIFLPNEYKIILNIIIDFLINISLVTFIYIAFKIRKKQPMSRFYLYSWAPIFISIMAIYGSQVFGVFSETFYIRYVLMYGCLFEMVINSFGLAYKNKITEEEKIKAEMEAKDKKKYQNLFRVVSHDISTPVATAQGWAESLDDSLIKEKIIQSLNKTCEIIDQVKIEEKRRNLISSEILTTDVFSELKNMQDLALKNKKINFYYKGKPLVMNINSGILINSILNNILNNSIKFSKEHGNIILSAYEEKDNIMISIEDNGIGMSQEKINEILHNTTISTNGTNGEKGTGLGLEIVKSYIEEFGAEMCIESDVGVGTKFLLKFKKNGTVQ